MDNSHKTATRRVRSSDHSELVSESSVKGIHLHRGVLKLIAYFDRQLLPPLLQYCLGLEAREFLEATGVLLSLSLISFEFYSKNIVTYIALHRLVWIALRSEVAVSSSSSHRVALEQQNLLDVSSHDFAVRNDKAALSAACRLEEIAGISEEGETCLD